MFLYEYRKNIITNNICHTLTDCLMVDINDFSIFIINNGPALIGAFTTLLKSVYYTKAI